MNLLLAILFLFSGASFSYRYVSWFAAPLGKKHGTATLFWLYGFATQVALFANFTSCNQDVWIVTLYILAIALASAHDIYLFPHIKASLFSTSAPVPVIPTLLLLCVQGSIVCLIRSDADCTLPNSVFVALTTIGAGAQIAGWKQLYNSQDDTVDF